MVNKAQEAEARDPGLPAVLVEQTGNSQGPGVGVTRS